MSNEKSQEQIILAEYNPFDSEERDWEWDDFVSEVQNIMNKMKITKFFAYGLSLTWRNVAGYTEFETDKARILISKLAPQSDFIMKFIKTENKGVVEVIISHHDKPMGETMYLMSQSMEKKLKIKERYF
jgi:hypothetical protein